MKTVLTARYCSHTSEAFSCTIKTKETKKRGKLERKKKRKKINTEHKLHTLYNTPQK
jgi:hypothetical protein